MARKNSWGKKKQDKRRITSRNAVCNAVWVWFKHPSPYRWNCFSASQTDYLRAQTAFASEHNKILTQDFQVLQVGYTATSRQHTGMIQQVLLWPRWSSAGHAYCFTPLNSQYSVTNPQTSTQVIGNSVLQTIQMKFQICRGNHEVLSLGFQTMLITTFSKLETTAKIQGCFCPCCCFLSSAKLMLILTKLTNSMEQPCFFQHKNWGYFYT